jgi:HEAT repeat protein
MTGADMAGGKFIAIDPGAAKDDDITLVPARVYTYVPLWGWAAIVLGLLVFAAAVIFLPGVSIERLASRLGDDNDIVVQQAMRALVVKGDERTVRTLFDMASSDEQGIKTRLRAVDTMSLIEEMPEVDRSLLRLELASGTNELVREAAIAARRQREAARARGNQ